ncbi:MAG TPA: hypothetical protein PK629_11530 [Oscillospiraceae bacterium]|nr:hypothetical protein [Oscillospiraceae bacterium]HPF54996.1 hypothetical protein [Clostridiales bacterium]HPK35936.1 hypothetical protein [Oscillospiraceae bacterium]HPR75630.1 hypothetical protein [Oscillospiraceae bacterium]
MSEAVKELRQTPEGYSPKERPEILRMAEENAGKGGLKQVNRVKTANGGRYIDGVPMLRWGEWKDNTYCGCVTALLNTAGVSVSYEEVMGLSGVCWQAIMRSDWDPSSQMPQNGRLCEKNVGDALGVDVYTVKDEKERVEYAKKSIDAGVPVLLVGGRWAPEWTLTCGYAVENSEDKFFGRTYFDVQNDNSCEKAIEHQSINVSENEIYTDDRYFYQNGFPGWVPAALTRFYDKRKEPISRKEALKVSLETSIKMFEQKAGEHHKFGYDAYDVLISGFELGEEEYRAKCRNDQYHIGSLMDARCAAAAYLETSVGLFESESAKNLAETAKIFQVMLDNLLEAVPYEKTTAVFNINADPVWDTAQRHKMAKTLRANKESERLVRKKIAEMLANWE